MAGLIPHDRENARRRYQRRLAAVYARASNDARAYGAEWYADAYREAEDIAAPYVPHVTPEQVAGAIAALSPRVHWHQNIANARALVDWYFDDESAGYRPLWELKRHLAAFPKQVDKAVDILGASDPLDVLHGPKERAFYRSIIGDTDAVTVDVWIARAAGALAPSGNARLAPGAYADVAAALKRASWRVGAAPRDFQAAVWVTIRDQSATMV